MRGRPKTFWGKLRRDDDDEVIAWHPLIDHCADVAACCEALLHRPVIARRLARLAGRKALDETTRARLAVLCALHDVGKFNHGFQRKGTRSRDTAGHVTEALALLDIDSDMGVVGPFLEALGVRALAPWVGGDGTTLLSLLSASIAHHGRPHAIENSTPSRRLWLGGEPAPLDGIRRLVEACRAWFPEAWHHDGSVLPDAPAFAHAFSGLVTLADWLGSNPEIDAFPYTADADFDPTGRARMTFARGRAAHALRCIGLDTDDARRVVGPAPAFDRISAYTARPAQEAVHGLPTEVGGSITVLEAETGSGKTEAALARFMTLFAAGEVDGLYFALPTRTAATQLEARVRAAMARLFGDSDARPPVTLAVPGYLRVDGVDGQRLARFEVLWNDRPSARWRFRTWAAENSKRYLAGAIVVGTIDQVLMSGLKVDHAHLRGLSLLRHLLVVDEVHASDAYMTRILETVLARHRSAGGHALLLSATLGGEARRRLLHPGERAPALALSDARAVAYPLVAHRAGGAVAFTPIEHQGRARSIAIDRAPIMDDADAIARRALAAAEAGARVLVLRNTVSGCLEVQTALESLAGGSSLLFRCAGVPAPHHSRFARVDREALDGAVEAHFGKQRDGVRGVVAVATQTVEQSLDLDADLMLTDLCPMDVLLQRVGRLHRHLRPASERPYGFAEPQAVVLVPAARDLAATVEMRGEHRGRGRAGHGLGSVYLDLRIIEATWRELERDPILRVPDDCRARVEATVHSEALTAIVGHDPRWQEHTRCVIGETLAKDSAAQLNVLSWHVPFASAGGLFPERGAGRPPTRLGDDDRLFTFERPWPKGPFGAPIQQLKVPGWMAHDVSAEPVVVVTATDAEGFEFTVDGAAWRYDRHGVKRA